MFVRLVCLPLYFTDAPIKKRKKVKKEKNKTMKREREVGRDGGEVKGKKYKGRKPELERKKERKKEKKKKRKKTKEMTGKQQKKEKEVTKEN